MAQPYPIIDQRPLDAAGRRKLLGMNMGSKTRAQAEVPRPSAHEQLVYRVGNRYRRDKGLGLSHDEVVNATHVSVVDMSRDKQVLVSMPIASRDAKEFQIDVTFICTVTDPEVVVEEGIDAPSALLSYLKSHHKVVRLGLDYLLSQINDVRVDVGAEIEALATIRPPTLPGLLIALASVEVATPGVVAALQDKIRDLEHTHTLNSLQQGYTQNLDQDRQKYEYEKAQSQQAHDQHLDQGRREHANETAHAQQQHDQVLQAEVEQHKQELDQGKTQYENAKSVTQQRHEQVLDEARKQYENAMALGQRQHEYLLAVEGQRYDQGLDHSRREYEHAAALIQQQNDHQHAVEGGRQERDLDQEKLQYENAKSVAQQQHEQDLDEARKQYENAAALAQRRYEHTAAVLEQQNDHQLAVEGGRQERDLDQEKLQYENAKSVAQQQLAHRMAAESQQHALTLQGQMSDHALREMEKAAEVLKTDPQSALQYAFHAGEIKAGELAASRQAELDRQRAEEQRRLDQERADEQRRRDQEHEERKLQLQWDREFQLRADTQAVEHQRFVRAIRVELLRDLSKRGYLDMVDPEAFATELLGDLTTSTTEAASQLPNEATPQLPSGDGHGASPADQASDGLSVREEDGD